ncbi:MAG TPA: hypothetical protein VE732_02620, partial [Nitrososphaera sp.]|nr:hypothetical protein [Nitrososphaera sp.]
WIEPAYRPLYRIAHTAISLGLLAKRQTKSRTTAIAVAIMMTFSFDFSAFQKEKQRYSQTRRIISMNKKNSDGSKK